MGMQRSIRTLPLMFTAMGGLVGSGWLFGAYYGATIAGPAAILSWVIGGVLMMFIALTFAELAIAYPVSGGSARFIHMSHGPFIGFMFAWIAWVASIAVAPIETMALIQYASNYIPVLTHKVQGIHVLTLWGGLGAMLLMASIVWINTIKVGHLTKGNMYLVIVKVAVPVMTIIGLCAHSFHLSNLYQGQGFFSMGYQAVFKALPAAGIIFSFLGYSPAIQLAGESKNPQKSIFIAIMGSLIGAIFLYVIIQTVFIGSLSSQQLSNGWEHLSFSGDAGPFAGMALALGMGWLAKILYIDAAISPFGTAFIYSTSTARMTYAMGPYLSKSLMKLNKSHVPVRALLLNYVLGLLLLLPFPGWQKMVGFLVSAFVLAYAVGPIALLSLRRSKPDVARPFKVPYARTMSLAAFYICNLVIYWTGWDTVYKVMIAVFIGGILYFINRRNQKNIPWKQLLWLVCYLTGLSMISFLGSFSGRDVIPFGWDFMVIAVFSVIILYASQKISKFSMGSHH